MHPVHGRTARTGHPTGREPPYLAVDMPWFLTLLGRDPLVAVLLSGLDGAWSAKGALAALGELQTNHATL